MSGQANDELSGLKHQVNTILRLRVVAESHMQTYDVLTRQLSH
jgi:hypothetical protein